MKRRSPAPAHAGGSLVTVFVTDFVRDWPSLVSILILLLVLVVAVIGPAITADPVQQSLLARMKPPGFQRAGITYLLGTDQLGRDVLARIVAGARVSLPLACIASLASLLVGTLIGLYSGFIRGPLGTLLIRLADIQIALPYVVLAIAIVASLGSNLLTLLGTLSLFGWAAYARVANAETQRVSGLDFVSAARTIGAPGARILFGHILPNVASPLIVLWTFNFAQLIIIESSLSFIGLGIQPPNPSWGNMLSDAREQMGLGWWLAAFPGLVLVLTVLAINVIGDRLRDLLDPRVLRR